MLYDKNPDNSTERPDWSKGVIKNIQGPGHQYTIENDAGKNVKAWNKAWMVLMWSTLVGSQGPQKD